MHNPKILQDAIYNRRPMWGLLMKIFDLFTNSLHLEKCLTTPFLHKVHTAAHSD